MVNNLYKARVTDLIAKAKEKEKIKTYSQFCKKYGTNFGGYCIELEKFKEILQTKGMQIFN